MRLRPWGCGPPTPSPGLQVWAPATARGRQEAVETGCGDARLEAAEAGSRGGAGLAGWKPPLAPRPPVLSGATWTALEGCEQGHEGRASRPADLGPRPQT